jgi:hypothetical protein
MLALTLGLTAATACAPGSALAAAAELHQADGGGPGGRGPKRGKCGQPPPPDFKLNFYPLSVPPSPIHYTLHNKIEEAREPPAHFYSTVCRAV